MAKSNNSITPNRVVSVLLFIWTLISIYLYNTKIEAIIEPLGDGIMRWLIVFLFDPVWHFWILLLAIYLLAIPLYNFVSKKYERFEKKVNPLLYAIGLIVALPFIILGGAYGYDQVNQSQSTPESNVATNSNESTEEPIIVPVSTTEPIVTPWLVEDFSSDKLNNRYWEEITCKNQYWRNLAGYISFDLDQEVECWLIANLERNTAEKISIQIHFPNEEAIDGYAGLLSSCGKSRFYYVVSKKSIDYQLPNEPFKKTIHQLYVPFNITIEAEWAANNFVKLYWNNENENKQLLSEFECSSLPIYIQIGAYTTEENPLLEVQINHIEITGTER